MARIFKTGSNRIVETEAMAGLAIEEVQTMLKTTYPEVANATIRTTESGDDTIVEFLPQPGRKG